MTKPMKPREHRTPLLYEKDGDFNPGWLLFMVFAGIGALICLGAAVAMILDPSAWQLGATVLGFISFAMLCTALIVVPIARAKLLVKLKSSVADVASSAPAPLPVGPATWVAGNVPTAGEVFTEDDLQPPVAHGRPE